MVKQKLKDNLIKNKIRDYVVMVNLEDQNRIIILKKEHAKTLGVHHCPHCGMEFENEIQLSVHQRIHYMMRMGAPTCFSNKLFCIYYS